MQSHSQNKFLLIILILIFGYSTAFAVQSERIISFKSDILIHDDGSMTAAETIRVMAQKDKIKRGIYRTFPTTYRDRFGKTIKVDFNVVQVLRDGHAESFHIGQESNGVKVYMGKENVFLNPGEYTYTLTYHTNRQLGYFDNFDELYWNVTGNDWDFTIEHASATVTLPTNATVMDISGYTGYKGDQGQNYSYTQLSDQVTFTTTRPLKPKQGLTIAVSWPKGYVPVPTTMDRVGFIFNDNPNTMAGMIGLIVLLIYYTAVWSQVGKDPERGTIIPLFSPPVGMSPAAARYIMKMGYSNRVFAAAIVNIAVKGYLNIDEDNGKFTLFLTDKNTSTLTAGEHRIAKLLFAGNNSIVLKQENHNKIKKAIQSLKNYLKFEIEKIHFARNSTYIIPGIVISILSLIALIICAPQMAVAIFITVWLSIWSIGVVALSMNTIAIWRSALTSKGGMGGVKIIGALFMTAFLLPFIAGEIFGLGVFSLAVSVPGVIVFIALIAVNILFYQLLKAPTLYGRQVMDKLDGFKMYMEYAEEDRLNFFHPPDKSPELFEKYLPFAIALGVENAWSNKFTSVLQQAAKENSYSPRWYSGPHHHIAHGFIGLASSLGSSFSSAIASSSTAPGSSSGSGGGGSSGGGGGGGGGGGW